MLVSSAHSHAAGPALTARRRSLRRDVHTGTALTSFKTNACAPGCLSLLGRDYLVAAQLGRGGGLHFWAWHKDQPHLRSFAAEQLTAVTATRDGTFCAAGGASGAVFVWETSSGRLLKSWPAHYKVQCTCNPCLSSSLVICKLRQQLQLQLQWPACHTYLLCAVPCNKAQPSITHIAQAYCQSSLPLPARAGAL